VEVSPPYDAPSEVTARLAPVAVLDVLHGMARRRLGI
jgi:hypothetical protein